MNLQAAVMDCYGRNIPGVPADGCMRTFAIDQFRIGFLISIGECHAFGCWSDGDIYYFDGAEWHGLVVEPRRPPKQELNRMIIRCARGLIECGEKLNEADMQTLKSAVRQVEAAC